MEIHWFAGHMSGAKRIIKEKLKLIDLVFELVDARIPLSSRCPLIADILGGKTSLLILNKADLADPVLTGSWVKWFRQRGVTAIPCASVKGACVEEVDRELLRLERAESTRRSAGKYRIIRCMVVGIPNVGKSMFINRLAGRRAARTGQFPGLTRGEQWIRIGKRMELLDTPGVLWPRLEDQEVAVKLAATGAIRENLFDPEPVAAWILAWMTVNKEKELREYFGLPDELLEIEPLLEFIGRKRGFLAGGGAVNRQKTSLHILKEFRTGKLGRCTLESPP